MAIKEGGVFELFCNLNNWTIGVAFRWERGMFIAIDFGPFCVSKWLK